MVKELLQLDPKLKVEKAFDDSTLLIDSELEREDFTRRIMHQSPIFIKHLMPVMSAGTITEDLINDRNEILSNMQDLVPLKERIPFAVQCRVISGGENGLTYSSKDVEVYIGEYYEALGNVPKFSDTSLVNEDIQIMSVFINKKDYYLGFSTSRENLNFHCNEYRIFSKGSGREISRAENKLKEALSKFAIQLSGEGFALDIGAAPGGWTKVLADHGYNVIAVDPGDLKPELQNHPRIKHYKCRIEALEFDNFFDIIVNDMNVDPQITAQIMNSLTPTLKEKGLAVVTLKLPDKVEEDIMSAVNILSEYYHVLTVKSLFHNRQEVTALIQKKTLIKEQGATRKRINPNEK